jgi:hypothetical protein
MKAVPLDVLKAAAFSTDRFLFTGALEAAPRCLPRVEQAGWRDIRP